MYSVSIKNNRVMLQCNMHFERYRTCSAVYDTGARYTALSALSIDATLEEKDYIDNEYKLLSGYIEGIAAKFYKVKIDELAIGNIILKNQDIWITFDINVVDNVVGYDVLSQIARLGLIGNERELFFATNGELKEYLKR